MISREVRKSEELVEGQVPKDLQDKQLVALPDGSEVVTQISGKGILSLWTDGVERNIAESWCKILYDNPVPTRCWTDVELVERMQVLFEGRLFGFYVDAKRVRCAYNAGRLAGQKGPPLWKSARYERRGGKLYKVSPRGTVVEEITGIRARVLPK